MAESTASKNERLSDWAADITAVSLHTADPGVTGTSEVTGGSPAYARRAPGYAAPASGSMNITTGVTFDVPGGVTVSWIGLWKGTTFMAGVQLAQTETFTGQGTYTLSSQIVNAT